VAEDLLQPAVVRLAHALDAEAVLAAARPLLGNEARTGALEQAMAAAELAALCGWDDVRSVAESALVEGLQAPLGSAAMNVQRALSDAEAFRCASRVIDGCPPELLRRAFGTLAANYRRMRATAPAAARDSALAPAAAATALAAADGAVLQVDGRVVALMEVPAFSDERTKFICGVQEPRLGVGDRADA
jgi:hypothetical protein